MSVFDEWRVGTDSPPRIRSFVLRGSRVTQAQQRALTELWERFGIESDNTPLAVMELFGRCVPLVVEIGFGDGESLAVMANACLLYTSPSPRDGLLSRMPSSA